MFTECGGGYLRPPITLVGAFPPPVHGMAAVNAAVLVELQQAAAKVRVIDLAALSLDRSIMSRFGRLPRVLRGLVILLAARQQRGGALYMSISGGLGQLYDLLFIVVARLRGMRLFLHYHSFAYLDTPSRLTDWLVRIAGANAVHVTLSPRMADRLKALYPVKHDIALSNAVFLLHQGAVPPRPRPYLRSLGFISNIAEEKGVFEFLELLDLARRKCLPARGYLAGPFQDLEIERKVRARLMEIPNVEYVGPKYGAEKESFFASIDILVFPTRYANEAEPLTIHEAMSAGVVVIAYGRGAIPEIIGADSGMVIEPTKPFAPAALMQIEAWLSNPDTFEAMSRAASRRFAETYAQNEQRWQTLLRDIAQ